MIYCGQKVEKVMTETKSVAFYFIEDHFKTIKMGQTFIEQLSGSLEIVPDQSVNTCLLALRQNKANYKHVRIVSNPDYETTLKNLLEKKTIIDSFKD